jgi:hypothetical protein
MTELMMLLSPTEREEVKKELTKLFILQDKSAAPAKIEVFLDEIDKYGFPYGAILAGLKDLQSGDLQHIRFGNILESVKDKIYVENAPVENCKYCEDVGIISMKDEKGRSFSFACICKKGCGFEKSMRIQKWNRQASQIWKGGNYTIIKNRI